MPLNANSDVSLPGFSPHIPACFTSLEEAQNSLSYHQNRCLQAAYNIDEAAMRSKSVNPLIETAFINFYSQSRNIFRGILRKWSSAFEAYLLASSASMDSKELQGAAVLKISHRTSSLHVEYHRENLRKQEYWDRLRRDCEEIVDLATSVVKLQNDSSNTSSKNSPLFSMDMSIVTPLFNIAHRCRDPIVRRKAIALLYSAPRQEGLWHSVLTARVAEKIMIVEEAGLDEVKRCEDIPEEKRITEIDVRFDLQGRKGYLKFGRRRNAGPYKCMLEPVTEMFEEVIHW